jgi:hypothetical protein
MDTGRIEGGARQIRQERWGTSESIRRRGSSGWKNKGYNEYVDCEKNRRDLLF